MFDPLHKWLGIPPAEQPPNDYRLLGLANFEDDPDVIDVAADRDLTFLHDLTNGEHGDLAEELSNRISAARLRLLNKEKKAAYDAELRAQLNEPEIDVDSVIESLSHQAETESPATESEQNQPGTNDQQPNASAVLGVSPDVVPAPAAATHQPTRPTEPAPARTTAASIDAPAAGPVVHTHSPRRLRRRRRLSLIWILGIIPGLIVLGYLVFSIWTGRLRLDRNKLEQLGFPAEQAAQLAGDSNNGRDTSSGAVTSEPQAGSSNRTAAPLPPDRSQPGVAAARPDVPDTDANEDINNTPAMPPPNSPSLAEYLTASSKHPLPSADSIAEKMQTVRDLYQAEYLQAKNRDQRIAVADKMRDEADETKYDPRGQFALYRVAREIYIGEGDFASAIEIVDLLDQSFDDIDVIRLKRDILEDVSNPIVDTDAYCEASLDLASECLDAGRIDDGIAVCEAMQASTRRIPTTRLARLKEVRQQLDDARSLLVLNERSAITLESNPDDADAQSAVGKYLCLVEHRWDDALSRLAVGSDPLYRDAASKELAVSTPDVSELMVADSWYKIIDDSESSFEKRSLADHAKTFYQSARLKTSGLEVRKIDQRLILLNALATPGPLSTSRIRAEQRAAAAKARAEAKDRALASKPKVIQTRTYDSNASTDFARIQGNTLQLGMGNTSSGNGEAAAGVEFDNVGTVAVQGAASHTTMTMPQSSSKIGFFIDYHTERGYTKRVFLNFGTNTPGFFNSSPPWGTARAPDDRDFLPVSPQYTIDLEKWAPPNWDGMAWFSLYMQNSGHNRMLSATLSWKARSTTQKME